jgi:hypothetical protein
VLMENDSTLAKVSIQEPTVISRALEYIELQMQLKLSEVKSESLIINAKDVLSDEIIPCQIFGLEEYKDENILLLNIIFPISIEAHEQKIYLLTTSEISNEVNTDLEANGEGLDLVIDNNYYRADLSRSDKSEAKNNPSGQLSELKIKMDFNQLLFRTENRMHWGPNFQKKGMEYYNTIAGWKYPSTYEFTQGPYLVSTHRQDYAPDHPEILLTANYSFYAGLPYFKFFSSMNIVDDIVLFLLRNDEMTMDSLFTHVAYQNNSGEIIDLSFSDRYDELEENPIPNDAPWLCFYNAERGYAFGSIRIKYDNTNQNGLQSPTYLPHTKISNGAEGGKYWNRRLIHENHTFVPSGSSYVEENAYIVFKINKEDKFKEIEEWMTILSNPLEISVIPKIFIKENN